MKLVVSNPIIYRALESLTCEKVHSDPGFRPPPVSDPG